MSVLEKLTEGIVRRDVSKEGQALLAKWEKTGLLEGISNENQRNGMAVLLENQAKDLLREASSMAAGDVEGFASVAFPIVRRVFGGLIANDLVSVQPMSLPSGLIFFLDFVHESSRLDAQANRSLYGGNRVASEITGGVDLVGLTSAGGAETGGRSGPGGFYNFGNAVSSPSGSLGEGSHATAVGTNILGTEVAISALTEAQKKAINFDPDILAATSTDKIGILEVTISAADMLKINTDQLHAVRVGDGSAVEGALLDANTRVVRRLTMRGKLPATGDRTAVTNKDTVLTLFYHGDSAMTIANVQTEAEKGFLSFPAADSILAADALGAVQGAEFLLEGAGNGQAATSLTTNDVIPEIDIRVDSIAVTAVTKKLKAKWTPELGQDLNAYHNLDAEVELTGILSEQIALEIDREILGDLVKGATAGTRYWSRAPGLFVDSSGAELGATSASPDFTGTVSEWYETLIETINDVSAQIHRKTLRGGANFVVCSPEVANILEFTSGFRASVTADADRGDIGAVKTGSLSKKFDVMVDPYFPRNVLLVGRRGNSFLESGYVYAPYVPLQVTPTIFGQEDFVPRKGVMTRYAKKMVRPDMYGLVIVRGLLGEAGA